MLRRISLVFLLLFSLVAQAAGVAGLTYDFYRGTGPQPSLSPLAYPTVVKTGVSPTISYSGAWGGTSTVLDSGYWDRFIVHWYGYINVPTTGTYTFGASADDGVIVKIDNTTVISGWYDSGGALRTGTPISLTAGTPVPIEIWYYENGGGQAITFWYLNNSSWTVTPTTMLATDSTYWTPATPTYSSGITATQQTRKTSETTQRTSQSGNQIYIDQAGDNNNFTIRQGVNSTGKNRIELTSNGNNNTLNINQGYTPTGTATYDSNDHYQYWNITGSSNNITTQQSGSSSSQFMEGTISGSSNTIDLRQTTGGNKVLFFNANGSSNNVTATQTGTGNHYLDINLTGNGHSVTANQSGTGNHAATIDLTNGGGASSVNLNQSGSTAQVYSIQQTCTNPAGCSVTVTQP